MSRSYIFLLLIFLEDYEKYLLCLISCIFLSLPIVGVDYFIITYFSCLLFWGCGRIARCLWLLDVQRNLGFFHVHALCVISVLCVLRRFSSQNRLKRHFVLQYLKNVLHDLMSVFSSFLCPMLFFHLLLLLILLYTLLQVTLLPSRCATGFYRYSTLILYRCIWNLHRYYGKLLKKFSLMWISCARHK